MAASVDTLALPATEVGALSSLTETLSYENDEIVYRFSEDYGVSIDDSRELFTEVKRWLWLCARKTELLKEGRPAPAFLPLLSEVYALDLMWHNFILFTKHYQEFCKRYFGFFIHHSPQTRAEQEAWILQMQANPDLSRKRRREQLEQVYGFIFDELGQEVLIRWCDEYPKRFQFLQKSLPQSLS